MNGFRTISLVSKYSAAATLGSLVLAYGLREFLRAAGGSYYCCRHAFYQSRGIALTFAGWVILLVTVVNLYGTLHGS